MVPLTAEARKRITEVASSAAFEPFGNPESTTLFFRSERAWLRVEWDRGYLHATLAARRPEGPEYDDDLLRQALYGEAPHPNGVAREWDDLDAFLGFLRDRLTELEEAVAGAHPAARERLVQVEATRRDLLRRWGQRLK